MNFISVLSCLSLLLGAAVTQGPQPCVVPQRISGGFSLATGGLFLPNGTTSIDAVGQRVLYKFKSLFSESSQELLMLYKENAYYQIDRSNLFCEKRPLDTTFSPIQVPEDGQYLAVFTDVGCFPVTYDHYGPDSEWVITLSTYNWVEGNTDPAVFIPPDYCIEPKMTQTETPDTMFTALKSLAMKIKKEE